ncbi:MAG: hypothetical protein ISR72_13020 [Methylobacter sp.]|nr:hypothetical protein [Methylobacter sp.]
MDLDHPLSGCSNPRSSVAQRLLKAGKQEHVFPLENPQHQEQQSSIRTARAESAGYFSLAHEGG